MKIIDLCENTLIEDKYSDYLMDASLFKGRAESLVFCQSSNDIKQIIDICYQNNTNMTIQGALTGICGGAVPNDGCIINISEMNKILGTTYDENSSTYGLIVEPGVLLKDIDNALVSKRMKTENWPEEYTQIYEKFKKSKAKFFPPDPTENLASIGGMVACDASGACSFRYGSTRHYINSIKVVTIVGGVATELYIKRGVYTYTDIHKLFDCDMELPIWKSHQNSLKDVAGLYYEEDMDLIDLFIGSEGLLGVISEIELKLIDAPDIKMGIMLFLENTNNLDELMNWLRQNNISDNIIEKPCAIEYFDKNTFSMLNEFRTLKTEISQLPIISEFYQGGLYLEFHLHDESILDNLMAQLFDKLESFGINEEEQWFAIEASDFEKLKKFRHSVPECVNILVANQKILEPAIKKVGTDMAVTDINLINLLKLYNTDIENNKLKAIIFGHIGDNHLHVNIIPDDLKSYQMAMKVVAMWIQQVIKWQGTVTAEHGVGKLKKEFLKQMMTFNDLESMKIIKNIIEPSGLISKGNLLD